MQCVRPARAHRAIVAGWAVAVRTCGEPAADPGDLAEEAARQ